MLGNIIAFLNATLISLLLVGCSHNSNNLTFKEFLARSQEIEEKDLGKITVENLSDEEKLYWYIYAKKQKRWNVMD